MSRREPDSGCSLLVRNISKSVRSEELRYSAEKYGRVRDVYIPKDFYTGESRGIGFVEFADPRDADDAIAGMDRLLLDGKEISVVAARQGRKRPEDFRHGSGNYGGGGGGGYRGGRRDDRGGSRYDRDYDRGRSGRDYDRGYDRGGRDHDRGSSRRYRDESRSPRRSYSRSRSRSRSRRSSYSRSRSPAERSRSREREPAAAAAAAAPVQDDAPAVEATPAERYD